MFAKGRKLRTALRCCLFNLHIAEGAIDHANRSRWANGMAGIQMILTRGANQTNHVVKSEIDKCGKAD